MKNQDKNFLFKAIEKAKESVSQGGFPAGAIVVKDGKIIGSGVSLGHSLTNDPTNHAEISAIREACKNLKTTNLSGTILYASLQPCLMCFGTSVRASVSKIAFACSMEKVAEEYYGGHYHASEINKELIKPIELVYIPELEEASLAVVKEWESLQK